MPDPSPTPPSESSGPTRSPHLVVPDASPAELDALAAALDLAWLVATLPPGSVLATRSRGPMDRLRLPGAADALDRLLSRLPARSGRRAVR